MGGAGPVSLLARLGHGEWAAHLRASCSASAAMICTVAPVASGIVAGGEGDASIKKRMKTTLRATQTNLAMCTETGDPPAWFR